MEMKYNVTGQRRKDMVEVISDIVKMRPVYMKVPTCNYVIDNFTVTRNGTLIFDEREDSETVKKVLSGLEQAGFEHEMPIEEAALEDSRGEQLLDEKVKCDCLSQNVKMGLTVKISLEKVAVENLTKLLDAKGTLIKKALGIDELPIEIGEERVSFPWFKELPEPDAVQAYTHFIAALCEMSRNQKRVTAMEKKVENEKYAFRCFLLRLGFIGAEYKTDRKILLKNLSGSSAFKSGQKGGAGDEISE